MLERRIIILISKEFAINKIANFTGKNAKNKVDLFSTKDEFGNTALYYAAGGGHHESVQVLIQNGVDVNIRNEDGNTWLHKAMMNDDSAMIRYLIWKGADVEAINDKGQTPIYFASK